MPDINFNLPTVATTYTDFPEQVILNIDAALQQLSVGLPTTNPTAANVPTGAIRWDTGLNRWRKWDGSAYGDLTGTYNFNANINATQLNMGDGASSGTNAIMLGASNDLRIYHDGNHSYIRDFNGTGNLKFTSDRVDIINNTNSAFMAKFFAGASVELYENNVKRFETTTNGINVTGNIAATGGMTIDNGTLHVDSSSNLVGVGTASPAENLHIRANSNVTLRLDDSGQSHGQITYNNGSNSNDALTIAVDEGNTQPSSTMRFRLDASEKLRIDSSSQFSFGSTNPQRKFDFADAGTPQMIIRSSAASSADAILRLRGARTNTSHIDKILFETNDTGGGNYAAGSLLGSVTSGKLSDNTTLGFIDLRTCQSSPTGGALGTTDTTVLRATSSGRIAIGTTGATALLTLSDPSPRVVMTDTTTGADHRLNADSSVGNFAIDVDLNAEISDPSFIVNLKGSEKLRLKNNGRLGLGVTSPDCNLHVVKGSAGSVSADGNAVLAIENNNHCVFNMLAPNNRSCYIMMGDPQDTTAGQIRYDNNSNQLLIDVNGGEAARFGSNRFFGIHTGTVDLPLHVKQTSSSSGAIRIEDADSNNRHTDINVIGAETSFISRTNNNHGRVLFKSTNGTNTVENMRIEGNAGGINIGTTTNDGNVKLRVDGGRIETNDQIRAGRGSGGVALTVNDGGGNSQICFNHASQVPEQNGTSGRISVNTDSTGGVATMSFGLVHNASNNTTAGASEVLRLSRGTQANLGGSGNTLRGQAMFSTANTTFPTITFSGDTDTGISRSTTNTVSIITGGTERFRINNSGVDVRSGSATAVNTAKAWIHLDGSGTVTNRRSFNVDSVVDRGTGLYRVNWDNNFPNTYYAICLGQSLQPNNGSTHGTLKVSSQLTSRIEVLNCRTENSSDRVDKDMVSVAAFS